MIVLYCFLLCYIYSCAQTELYSLLIILFILQGIPASAEYRVQVEKTLNFINKTCVAKGGDVSNHSQYSIIDVSLKNKREQLRLCLSIFFLYILQCFCTYTCYVYGRLKRLRMRSTWDRLRR